MKAQLLGLLGKLFPVQNHEWPKAAMLLSAAAFLGMGASMSRVAAEGLFLTRFGVEYYPYLQLVNPFLVMVHRDVHQADAYRDCRVVGRIGEPSAADLQADHTAIG